MAFPSNPAETGGGGERPAESKNKALLNAALAYAARGWLIFPITAGAKIPPLIKAWQNNATTDPGQIRMWWTDNPQANIGINCGASGLFVVDQDVKDGVDGITNWRALAATNGFSSDGTLTNITPSGGRHSIYQKPDGADLRNTQNKAGEWAGIDTRGNGGYIVAPPSVVGDKAYRFEDDSVSVLPLPAPAVALFTAPKKKPNVPTHKPVTTGAGGSLLDLVRADGHALERKGTLAEWCGKCPWCGGHDRFVVGWDGEGRDGGQRYYCRQCERKGDAVSWLIDCKGVGVVEAKDARGVAVPTEYRKSSAKIGEHEPASGTAAPAAKNDEEYPAAPKLAVKRASDLMRQEFAPLKWIIPGILPEGYGVLAGRPKLGKSYLALDFCIAVAGGSYAIGERECERRRVLYCGLEDGERRLQKRMREVSGQNDIPELLDYLAANGLPRLHKGGLDALDTHLTEHPDTGLVVIDTYAKVRPPKPANADPYQHDYDNGAALADLARKHGACILAVLHARKAQSEDFIDEITGTLGIAGAADVIMVMRRARGSQDVAFHITGKDVPEQGLSLRCDWETKSWTIAGDLDAVQHTREVREVLDVMTDGKELSPRQIAELTGIKIDTVTHRLRTMLKVGVEGFEQARYGKYKYKHSFSSFSSFSHSVQSVQSREGKNEQKESEYRSAKSKDSRIEEGVL